MLLLKSCGRAVEGLWRLRTLKSFFCAIVNKNGALHCVDAPSVFLSLEPFLIAARIPRRFLTPISSV
jgi:hypothetical protein